MCAKLLTLHLDKLPTDPIYEGLSNCDLAYAAIYGALSLLDNCAGLYGSMNSLLYDHATVAPRPLRIASAAPDQAPRAESAPLTRGSIFGPSCDGLDTVLTDYPLPRLESGDWLVFAEHGAYTFCGACAFNGMDPTPSIFYIFSET